MLPDQVSNPGPLTYESGALPIALRGPAGSADEHSRHQSLSYNFKTCKLNNKLTQAIAAMHGPNSLVRFGD